MTWSRVQLAQELPLGSGTALVYDSGRKCLVAFGGSFQDKVYSSETWELSSLDPGSSTTSTNHSPTGITATAAATRVRPATPVQLTGAATDPDGDPLSYAWSLGSQPGTGTLTGASTATPTFRATRSGTYTVHLTVSDGRGGTGQTSVSIVVNSPPAVDAGSDVTAVVGSAVTLSATGTDDDLEVLTYAWSQTFGPAVSPTSWSTRSISFTLPLVGGYAFTVTASDPNGDVAQDAVALTATAPPRADLVAVSVATTATRVELGQPLAVTGSVRNGGDATSAVSLASFQLSLDPTLSGVEPLLGTASLPALAPNVAFGISASWAVPGSVAPGGYHVGLTVDSGGAVSESNESNNVAITDSTVAVERPVVRQPNLVARAISGPSTVRAGDAFSAAAVVENSGNADVTATFALEYVLSANPGFDASDRVLGAETLPGLAAGARSERYPSLSAPAGTAAGGYHLLLRVDPPAVVDESSRADNTVASVLTVQVTSRPADTTPPTANLAYGPGPTLTTSGTLTITATFSEPLSATPAVQLSSDGGRLLGGAMAPAGPGNVYVYRQPFGAADSGAYTVSLRAVDEAGNALVMQPANNLLTVAIVSNRPPVANAGPDRTVSAGSTVRLEGSGTDPDGDPLTYSWLAPDGVTLSDPASPTPAFTPTAAATHRLVLRVSDSHGAWDEDGVDLTVGQVTPGLQTELLVVRGIVRLESGDCLPAGSRVRIENSRTGDVATGRIRTVAGTGVAASTGDGGAPAAAAFNSPAGLTVDSLGVVLVTELLGHRVRRIDLVDNTVETLAGNGIPGYGGDGGSATQAQLFSPIRVAVRENGDLVIADRDNHRVRLVEARSGLIRTLAGTGTRGFSLDGTQADRGAVASPQGLAVAPAGDLVFADTGNHRVRRIVSPVAAGPDDHPGSALLAGAAETLAVNGPATNGNLEVAGDVDFFRFEAGPGSVYRLQTALGTLDDTVLTLFDRDGSHVLAENDDVSGGRASRLEGFRPREAGIYYARVRGFQSQATGTDTLSCTAAALSTEPQVVT
ncbi:MAG: PKD domain-containing protein, partial [Candidatus Riflebacteria bacterium]|nr:PKD domain-containing protein [Candidatus Riflebacteria bacterium]